MSRRRVPRGVSTPGKRLCGPTYVGLAENLVVIRASRRRTGLGCDERSARSAFHRLDPRLAPSVSASLGSVFNRASRGLGTLVAWCRIARRRPAIRASASRYLAELGAAVDARSRVRRHCTALCGEDASYRLLQPIHFNVHLIRIVRCSRCGSLARAARLVGASSERQLESSSA